MASRDVISDLGLKSTSKHEKRHPSPLNIEVFIPWACGQLELPFVPIINKVQLSKLPAFRHPLLFFL